MRDGVYVSSSNVEEVAGSKGMCNFQIKWVRDAKSTAYLTVQENGKGNTRGNTPSMPPLRKLLNVEYSRAHLKGRFEHIYCRHLLPLANPSSCILEPLSGKLGPWSGILEPFSGKLGPRSDILEPCLDSFSCFTRLPSSLRFTPVNAGIKSGVWSPILQLECRGLEPVSFHAEVCLKYHS